MRSLGPEVDGAACLGSGQLEVLTAADKEFLPDALSIDGLIAFWEGILAKGARPAGTGCRSRCWPRSRPSLWHDHLVFAGMLREADEAMAEPGTAIRTECAG